VDWNGVMFMNRVSRFGWQAGLFGLISLALFSFAGAVFFLVGDDFVLGGEVVPASDARILALRLGLGLAGLVFAILAGVCYRHMHEAR